MRGNIVDGFSARDLKQKTLEIFKKNPDKYYTPRMIFDIIQKRDVRFFSNALWSLWKLGFLIHNNRRYYRLDKNQK